MKIMIGENIKRLRKQKNITQEQLAEALNITYAAVSKWERGETYPDITLLMPLAYYFGVTLDELMDYDWERINREIEELLEEYRVANWPKNREIIAEAYKKYPEDHRVMYWYMWNIVGGSADNDNAVILKNEKEISHICGRILSDSTDDSLRHGAITMQGKIMHAKGRTAEALELYRSKLDNWYNTADQKCEQLFTKDTPEFLRQVKLNAYELASFCADKLHKSIFFDKSIPYRERVKRIESFADSFTAHREGSGEFFWAVMEGSILGRLANDLILREGEEADIIRVCEKLLIAMPKIEESARREGINDESRIVYFSRSKWRNTIKESERSVYAELRKLPKFNELIEKYC